ncbi:MAG: acyl carrier protein [Desulfatiglans sp.]|jgi:acyl carrier protein|nr:acyl carrier protein [Desulfatiglans sp.]
MEAGSLEKEILDLIIEVCNVEDIPEKEIKPDDPLIGPDSPLMLDSLDSVEIVVAIQSQYTVRIDNQRLARRILKSLKTLADFVRSETQDR